MIEQNEKYNLRRGKIMKQQNPLFFLFKRLSWPYGLIIAAVIITSLGSLSGLLVPLFTGRIVDKFSVSAVLIGA